MAQKASLEIVIPIYNEEKELEQNISKLHSFLVRNFNDYKWHITIADNASTDMSFNLAKKLSSRIKNVDYFHFKQKGRGLAVKSVWEQSKADYLSYMDVDLSTDLKYYKPLINSLKNGFDLAIGNRLMDKSIVSKRPLNREILSRGYNILIRILFNVNFSDAQCGFKAITKKAAKNLLPYINDTAWFFDSELLIIAEKAGFSIHQVPVRWTDNPGSTVRVLKTVFGDLTGLWRLFWARPWLSLKNYD